MSADPLDRAALVVFAVDQFAVDASVRRIRDLLHDKIVFVLQGLLCRDELLGVQAHDDDFVGRRSVIFADRADMETACQRLAPAFDLAVSFSVFTGVFVEESAEILIAEGAVFALNGAENTFLVQFFHSQFHLFPGHGHIIDQFITDGHIAAGTGDHTVKAVF